MKALVVFYSRSGRTREVGLEIAQRLGADVEEIKTRPSYRGFVGLWRCVAGAIRRVEFAIETPAKQAKDYDVVVVGAPIWGGRAAAPVLNYLGQVKGTARKVALFATSGGAQRPSVWDEMEEAVGAKSVARLALDRARLRSGDLSADVKRFVDAVTA